MQNADWRASPGIVRSIVVVPDAVTARHGLRIAGDSAVDFDAITGAQGGFELDDLAEDADFLRVQIDVREHLEDAGARDGVADFCFVRDLDGQLDLLCVFRVGDADLHDVLSPQWQPTACETASAARAARRS